MVIDILETLAENMSLLDVFVSIFLIFLAIGCLAMGAFLVYFGTGNKQRLGGAQMSLGLFLLLITTWFLGLLPLESPVNWATGPVVVAILSALALILGFGVAIGMFMMIMMKKK